MPISTADLQYLGKTTLDEFMRNAPVDQVSVDTPLLKKLMERRKTFLGAKQNVVVNIRKSHDSNFAWAYGEAPVSFNKRQTTDQAAFPWRRAVDGFYISHDTLFGNGIKVREGERREYKVEKNEKVQLLDLLNEQMEAFRIGFNEKLSLELHRDGTASADAVTGLDSLIALNPATGIVGGIDRSIATYWRNNAATGIASTSAGALATAMEAQWRKCIRNGGSPDFILAGSSFIDAYRQYAVTVTNNTNAGKVKRIDAGVGSGTSTGLYFKGVEIIWDPQFEALDALDSPTTPWEKRCYFINSKFMEFRDDDLDIVSPTRPYNILALYQMINMRVALVLKRANAHAVLSIA
ncbi:phage major capsid protein [Oxalobacter vibrioformis]|uniref:Phage major capsid protein n=1 Tax=Oxalobacter vibrioformis TaxID=933080 RepID=A0A9E9P2G7_9BURK|nr:phage major capsid protein [Oxalobacter vibrioformis]WAW09882.1 phage major capsid protein [Oxalobacter vibrioformis]